MKIKQFDVFWRSSPCLAVEASRRVVLSRPGLGVLGRDVLNKIARVQRDAGHDGARLHGVLHGRDLRRIKGVAHNSLKTPIMGHAGAMQEITAAVLITAVALLISLSKTNSPQARAGWTRPWLK